MTVTLLFSLQYNDYRYPNLPYRLNTIKSLPLIIDTQTYLIGNRLNAIKSLPFHTAYSSFICILHHSHLFVGPEEKLDATRPRDH